MLWVRYLCLACMIAPALAAPPLAAKPGTQSRHEHPETRKGRLIARPEKLRQWTTLLRDQQPPDAYAAVYRVGRHVLVFVAAVHANRNESLTFRLIRDAYASFKFDAVIAEGFPTSRGPNPATIFKYVSENGARADGLVEAGELVPAAIGARAQGALLWGGEPDDLEVKSRLGAQGVSPEDVLGFYVLRNIPQWIAEGKLQSAADGALQQLVVKALTQNREKLQLQPSVLPTFDAWTKWYKALNAKPIDGTFATEEVGPLADGRFGTNKIAYAVSRVRDAYLHELIIKHLNQQESVLVVFGGSHLMIHLPALESVVGRPCYLGADLRIAAARCRPSTHRDRRREGSRRP